VIGHGKREGLILMKNLIPRAVCAVVLAVGLAGGPAGANAQVGVHSASTVGKVRTITIHSYLYTTPKRVLAGARVRIVNKDAVYHSVTAYDESFGATLNEYGTAFITAPSQPGRYSFYCNYHSAMQGVLVVK